MRVGRGVLDAIVAHAREEAPLECCGLLIGSGDLVEASYAVENLRRSETAFEVDPAGHFAAIRLARSQGKAVVGAYHSHPRSAAHPSETDIRDANDPDLFHVIVSLKDPDPEVRAYRIREGRVVPVPLTAAD